MDTLKEKKLISASELSASNFPALTRQWSGAGDPVPTSSLPGAREDIKLGPISIQWLADPMLCPVCGETVVEGPVGYSTNEPAGPRCDMCLQKEDRGLGMLLWWGLLPASSPDRLRGLQIPLSQIRPC